MNLAEGRRTGRPSIRAFLFRQGWFKVFQVAKSLDISGDPGACSDSTALWNLGKKLVKSRLSSEVSPVPWGTSPVAAPRWTHQTARPDGTMTSSSLRHLGDGALRALTGGCGCPHYSSLIPTMTLGRILEVSHFRVPGDFQQSKVAWLPGPDRGLIPP